MTQDFQDAMKFIFKWEGTTYENVPNDSGGATCYGVVEKPDYEQYRISKNLPQQSVRYITEAEADEIYDTQYAQKCLYYTVGQLLGLVFLDTAINQGLGAWAKILQKALGTTVDGNVGPATIAALSTHLATKQTKQDLALKIINLRAERYKNIVNNNPSQNKFLKGWLARLRDLSKVSGIAVSFESDDEVARTAKAYFDE